MGQVSSVEHIVNSNLTQYKLSPKKKKKKKKLQPNSSSHENQPTNLK